MRRLILLIYGVTCYAMGLASLVYMIGWLGNVVVPRSIDSEPAGSVLKAVLMNVGLFAVFAVQHSVMARPAFKTWLTRFMPESAERSTYILFSGLALVLLMVFWQPMGMNVWDVQNSVGRIMLYSLYGLGWVILVGSTFVLNHFDLFGLRQVWLNFRNRPYTHLNFATPGPYRFVRHPIYVGWIMLVWAAPTMSAAHLAFALATTVYIVIAIQFEEKDLISIHGDTYTEYRRRTPMLIPSVLKPAAGPGTPSETNAVAAGCAGRKKN
jgi:protein-S-isoprenylcysteine O-methyltransferase Ste14